MHTASLSAGLAKLYSAAEMLERTWADTKEVWNDDTSRHFDETRLRPLLQEIAAAAEATTRMSEVLVRAQRDCEP